MNIQTCYEQLGFTISSLTEEKQNEAYCAYSFTLNTFAIKYREAKVTPTKIGQFVSLWQYDRFGTTQPFSSNDMIDFVIISVSSGHQHGQFIFPKHMLIEKSILSSNNRGGKRGFRVYPAWDKPTALQAIRTQAWQVQYFIQADSSGNYDPVILNNMFKKTIQP